jgi:hypothetical protein
MSRFFEKFVENSEIIKKYVHLLNTIIIAIIIIFWWGQFQPKSKKLLRQ